MVGIASGRVGGADQMCSAERVTSVVRKVARLVQNVIRMDASYNFDARFFLSVLASNRPKST